MGRARLEQGTFAQVYGLCVGLSKETLRKNAGNKSRRS
jgi:hypothetical protein